MKFHDSILYDLSLSHVYDDGKVDDGLKDARPSSNALYLSGDSWEEQLWGKMIVRRKVMIIFIIGRSNPSTADIMIETRMSVKRTKMTILKMM